MATIDQLTTAAKDALNAHDFGEGRSFNAFENYVPRIERSKMDPNDDWRVWIVTADLTARRKARERIRKECMFDVALIRRLENSDAESVNPCLAFADDVQSFVAGSMKKLLGHDLISNDFDPLYSEQHLKEHTVFLSVLAITYRRWPS